MAEPPDSNIPSLKNPHEVDDPQVTARAFGRKRGSFGAARGDLLLPPGRTVASVVESVVGSALRGQGYDVVPGPAPSASETTVEVKILEFWSYFRPGAFQVAVHFIARLEIRADLPGWNTPVEVVAEDELRKGAINDARWIALVERALGVLEAQLAQQLPPPARAAPESSSTSASSGGEAPRDAPPDASRPPEPCTQPWYARVEASFPVSDAEGHGPDLGSEEWMRALEQRQGLDALGLPEPGTQTWCERVDQALFPR